MSRTLFERWGTNPLNGLIIPGYTVDNTLAKKLFSEPSEVETMAGPNMPRRITVDSESFSGHSYYNHTSQFIEQLKTKRVILVHGTAPEMERLRERLMKDFAYFDIEVRAPANCEQVNFEFKSNPSAVVHGNLQEAKEHLSGLIIRKDFAHTIVAPAELPSFSTLKILTVDMKQQVMAGFPLEKFKRFLERHFEPVAMVERGCITIGNAMKIEQKEGELETTVEWRSDPVSDMLADNVAMMLACANPEEIEEDVDELFVAKLELALQCRWGKGIVFDRDAQIFEFEIAGENVLIALNPDSRTGVEISCRNDEVTYTIARLSERLYQMSRSLNIPKSV
jgi:cleavage and polyadenylation specificity factor subunit 3